MEKLKKTQTIISDTDGGRCEKASEGAGEGLAQVVRKGTRTEGMQFRGRYKIIGAHSGYVSIFGLSYRTGLVPPKSHCRHA